MFDKPFEFTDQELAAAFRPIFQDTNGEHPIRYAEAMRAAALFMSEADGLDFNRLRLFLNLQEAMIRLYAVYSGQDMKEFELLTKYYGYPAEN
ncbi:MAG: hypothetical protein IPH16_16160 [Haliscomenobacter sp.]|nr:hypothetical protein [Haliscomenobacter sp.]MBK7477751.1 hypothetical protein [Haliscomenobacter sp.]